MGIMPQKKYFFDHVSILMPGGGHNLLSSEEFLAKPLNERISLVLSGRVQFLCDGKIVPLKLAFKSTDKT